MRKQILSSWVSRAIGQQDWVLGLLVRVIWFVMCAIEKKSSKNGKLK